ncbi:hypothetical protein JOM56_001895 [Amanita muscaria]
MRPCSPPSCLPLDYEQLDPEWERKTMIVSCRVVSLRRRWFSLFGKPVPIIDCTPSSCPDHKTTNDNADNAASSPCRCPDCSDSSYALPQSLTEAETLDDWAKSSGSGHVVEVTSKLPIEQTTAETTSTTAETLTTSAETTIDTEIMGESAPETADQEFKYWVTHSGSEIASKLGTEKKDIDITAKELLISLEPPPPPSDTVPGYNSWLDKSRPTTIEEYLRNFEVVFVVDDSGSMKGERWTETRDALATIAKKTFQLKVDTVSLRFLHDARYVRGLRASAYDKKKLVSWFDKVKPRGNTPLGRRLNVVFEKHLDRIDSAVRESPEKYSKIPPLDIIVLTDGMPTDKGEDEPSKVVAKAVKRLNDSHYHPNTMGVQIVQIANEEKAKKMLRDLVVGDNGRIVDTVPYAGVVDSEKLLRILLGGVHPNIRSQLPVAMLAFEQQHE